MTPPADRTRAGLLFGIAAYASWGVIPIYWRLFAGIDPAEILAHRAVFGLVTFVAVAAALGELRAVWRAARQPRTVAALALSALLLAGNWGIFIYATLNGHLLEASLGYFINPLFSVALGVLVLRERLGRLQLAAIALATAGVVQLSVGVATPWVSLGLAASFAIYGLVRKTVPVEAVAGSALETAVMAPMAIGYLVYLAAGGTGVLGHEPGGTHLLVASTGLITALPLIWFTAAARRLTLAMTGFLQYLAPTGQFLTAVLLFREPLEPRKLVAFAFIWAGLGIFTADALRRHTSGRSTDAAQSGA